MTNYFYFCAFYVTSINGNQNGYTIWGLKVQKHFPLSSCTSVTHAHIGISLFSSCLAVIWCFLYILKGFSLFLRVLEFICGQPFHLFFLKLNEHFQCWNHFLRYGKFSSVITLRIAPPPTHLTYSLFSSWNWIRYIWNFQNYPPYLFLVLSFFSPFLCDFSFLYVCATLSENSLTEFYSSLSAFLLPFIQYSANICWASSMCWVLS